MLDNARYVASWIKEPILLGDITLFPRIWQPGADPVAELVRTGFKSTVPCVLPATICTWRKWNKHFRNSGRMVPNVANKLKHGGFPRRDPTVMGSETYILVWLLWDHDRLKTLGMVPHGTAIMVPVGVNHTPRLRSSPHLRQSTRG